MERSKADSFSAYLEAKQRVKASPAPAGGTALSLLTALAGAPQKTMPVADLMSATGMGITGFADALKSVRELGYITVSGPPTAESATLTQMGEDVARLSQTL
jgi:hypothetical protein